MVKPVKLVLRTLRLDDIESYKYWTHPSRKYHKYNGPYFKHAREDEHSKNVKNLKNRLEAGEKNVLGNRKIIADLESGEIIGLVNWYWKSEETKWLEVGIVIFNENYWGIGIGYEALKLWINEIFINQGELVRIGLSTWSGNTRMVKLAQKLGLKKEAEYRKARIVDGKYFDSVSFGILREEWEGLNR